MKPLIRRDLKIRYRVFLILRIDRWHGLASWYRILSITLIRRGDIASIQILSLNRSSFTFRQQVSWRVIFYSRDILKISGCSRLKRWEKYLEDINAHALNSDVPELWMSMLWVWEDINCITRMSFWVEKDSVDERSFESDQIIPKTTSIPQTLTQAKDSLIMLIILFFLSLSQALRLKSDDLRVEWKSYFTLNFTLPNNLTTIQYLTLNSFTPFDVFILDETDLACLDEIFDNEKWHGGCKFLHEPGKTFTH